MRRKAVWSMFFFGSLLAFFGCSKSDNENAILQVMLTDAPADYDGVYIDIQDVQIHTSAEEGEEGWMSLNVNKGVYNLLDFRNGKDTLLASVELPAGTVSQIRLILGEDNQLSIDDQRIDLTTPSSQQSGLKLNIHMELVEGITYKLWVDFDATRSIVASRNGKYILKPVIRTFTQAVSGAIKGIVSPAEARPYIRATMNGDTVSAMAADNGYFMLKGMSEGSWTLEFFPVEPYISLGINSVIVEDGFVTDMDTVILGKP